MSNEEFYKEFKSMFPEDAEVIMLTKENYDKQLGKLQQDNLELLERIERVLMLLKLVKENKKDLNKYNQVIEDVLKGDK